MGKDRVQIRTADDAAAIAELGREFVGSRRPPSDEGTVTFFVDSGEEFVPRLLRGLTVPESGR